MDIYTVFRVFLLVVAIGSAIAGGSRKTAFMGFLFFLTSVVALIILR